MPRKLSDIVQFKLRIREELRRRLERAAKRHGVSINHEIAGRIERSFDHDATRTLDIVARDIEINWALFGDRILRLHFEAETARHLAELIARIEQLIGMANSESELERHAALGSIKDTNARLRGMLRGLEIAERTAPGKEST
jgi:hypothetical protein